MTEEEKDVNRAINAAHAIFDGREDNASIMVTLEHVVASMLLFMYRDPRVAAGMLNEGLVHGIERRIALHHSRQPK